MVAGSVAGSAVGGAVGGDGWGDLIGRGVGSGLGMAAADYGVAAARDLPTRITVAISPTEVYLLGMPQIGNHPLEPLAKIHRDKLGVRSINGYLCGPWCWRISKTGPSFRSRRLG